MPGQDDDLLARLNRLKASSVASLSTAPKALVNVQANVPQSREDKLADRLKALRSGGAASPGNDKSLNRRQDPDALTAQIQDEVASERDPIQDWHSGDGDERTLDELIAELGSDDQWRLDPNDPKHIESLLKEAEDALPPPECPALEREQKGEGDEDWEHVAKQDAEDQGADAGERKTEDQQDDEAADDYVPRVLAELEAEEKYRDAHESPELTEADHDELRRQADSGLPSTPASLPPPPSSHKPPSYEDSELEARFSKLGLDLPSTPSAPPSAKPKVTASVLRSAMSNLPTYTDEDIDSWCCICNEDGEVRCLGCDGDIYCHECWHEGHGNGLGQERGHRAVQYVRKGGRGSMAAT